VYGEKITEALAEDVGKAFGTYIKNKSVSVAIDSRLSGPSLKKALVKGLKSAGCKVINFGIVPTPLLAFGTRYTGSGGGVMITASHNPAKYNGFKTWDYNGRSDTVCEEEEIEQILVKKKFLSGKGSSRTIDIKPKYSKEIKKRFKFKLKKKVLVDCANGAACEVSPKLLKSLGFDVVSVNDKFDGKFPNRLPEPIEENLRETSKILLKNNAEIGFCHDGDADRMIPIDDKGRVCDLDKFIAFLAKKQIEETGVKKIVTTVDASMAMDLYLGPDVEVIRTRVGDFAVAEELEKQGGCIGVEPGGAVIYPEFGPWPDGVYSIFKVLKFLESDKRKLSEIMDSIQKYPFKRIKITCREEDKENIMEKLKQQAPPEAKVSFTDGLRFEWGNSWILIRPSGTEPIIRLTGEGRTEQDLNSMMDYWEARVKELI
jgi:phosphoglucosamine mutase